MNFIEDRILNNYDFSEIMTGVSGELGSSRLVIRVPVHDESEIFKSIYDNRGEVLEEKRDLVSSYFISSEKPYIVKDFAGDIFRSSDLINQNTKALLVIPLRFSGRNIAVILGVYDGVEPEESVVNVVNDYLPLLSLLVAYRIKEFELSESAFVDRLTNLPSSSYFWQRVDEEYRRAKRYSRKFSILLIDIDNLKDINEKYGPRTTDKLLRKFADLLKTHFRSTDIITRFGGDEFAVILPETGAQSIYQVAEGFRLRVMSTPFEIEFGPTLNITVTVAAVNYPAVPEDPDSLVERLLTALAEGKEEGGNRTVLKNY